MDMHIIPAFIYASFHSVAVLLNIWNKEIVLTVEDGALCRTCFHSQIENNSHVLDSSR